MLEGRFAEIYQTLWHLSDAATPPVPVSYENVFVFRKEYSNAGSMFFTELGDEPAPMVAIRREVVPAARRQPDLSLATVEELVLLALARGHEKSWREGQYQAETPGQRRRAETNARALLEELGFEAWDEFDRVVAENQQVHRNLDAMRDGDRFDPVEE